MKMMTVGGGSSSLKVRHECTPLEGIRAAVGNKAEVLYERGYVGDVTGDYNGVRPDRISRKVAPGLSSSPMPSPQPARWMPWCLSAA